MSQVHMGTLYSRFIAGLGFYGLSYNVGNLTGSVYINSLLSGVADLPTFSIILLSSKLGRKVAALSCLFLGAVTLISAAFMSAYLDNGEISFYPAKLLTVQGRVLRNWLVIKSNQH